MFSIKDLKELYTLFEDVDVGEIEFQQGELKVRMVSGGSKQKPAPVVTAQAPAPASQTPAAQSTSESSVPESSIKDVTSKWVGIFTRLNPKTKEAYVKLRDVVKKGDVIAHVRVLGHLQDVVCEFDGKVKEILVEEGQPVEYGQPLFRIEA
ncbi:acetyl-CoA carboxylase biotin carboxyl carrier protein [Thermospira aquatica]|uniref:Biotin/lipoyl-binding protein n=1 Tax=Thermospira aquatica TaxID=2828656 RepID=A0AAX3BCU1_9SPIR|nr:biotin/lipoyl-binding protein [Thermospira aquatica]URA10039.1 biotin/lipoyl-binding protein [Thermospira aquatica]